MACSVKTRCVRLEARVLAARHMVEGLRGHLSRDRQVSVHLGAVLASIVELVRSDARLRGWVAVGESEWGAGPLLGAGAYAADVCAYEPQDSPVVPRAPPPALPAPPGALPGAAGPPPLQQARPARTLLHGAGLFALTLESRHRVAPLSSRAIHSWPE